MPDEYRMLESRDAEHLLLRESKGNDVYLTVSPRVLAGAMTELGGKDFLCRRSRDELFRGGRSNVSGPRGVS
jgi:hypothetical protein